MSGFEVEQDICSLDLLVRCKDTSHRIGITWRNAEGKKMGMVINLEDFTEADAVKDLAHIGMLQEHTGPGESRPTEEE